MRSGRRIGIDDCSKYWVGIAVNIEQGRCDVGFAASIYRGIYLLANLGWVDLDLEFSTTLLGQHVAAIAAHQPGELPKS